MADIIFTGGKNQLLQAGINLASDTIKLALCTSSFAPNQDTTLTFNQVSNEVTNANYTAGGATLSGKAVTPDNTNHKSVLTASNVSWTNVTLTARYGVLYKYASTNANLNPLICCFDFAADKTASGGTFEVDWAAAGILALA